MTISFYTVRSGDQLLKIAYEHYGMDAMRRDREAILERIARNNPQIKDPDKIWPGQVIMLPSGEPQGVAPPQICRAAVPVTQHLARQQPATLDLLSWIDTEKALDYGVEATDGFADLVGKAVRKAKPHIQKVALEYYRKDAGMITKGEYDYRRRASLQKAEKQLGVLRPLIYPRRRVSEVVRIKPHAAMRTHRVMQEVDTMARISKVMSRGAVVLKLVDAGMKIQKYNAATTREEKTAVVVDSAGDMVGSTLGAAAGVALATVLLATPVGWLGVGLAMAGGIAGGEAGEYLADVLSKDLLYDQHGNRIDTWAERQIRDLF